jgi:hypothetical protein
LLLARSSPAVGGSGGAPSVTSVTSRLVTHGRCTATARNFPPGVRRSRPSPSAAHPGRGAPSRHPSLDGVAALESALDQMPIDGWSASEAEALPIAAERLMRVEARIKAHLMAETRALEAAGGAQADIIAGATSSLPDDVPADSRQACEDTLIGDAGRLSVEDLPEAGPRATRRRMHLCRVRQTSRADRGTPLAIPVVAWRHHHPERRRPDLPPSPPCRARRRLAAARGAGRSHPVPPSRHHGLAHQPSVAAMTAPHLTADALTAGAQTTGSAPQRESSTPASTAALMAAPISTEIDRT